MYTIFDGIRELNTVSIYLRLFLAIVFGGVIGYDRSKKRRPAGMKTHMLVCLGATMTMLTSQYITDYLRLGSDPARMGAQVVSGIGFLGAGTIMVTTKNQVRGLTTAAGLWACGCMGLALGVGFYEGALSCFIFIGFVLPMVSYLENQLTKNSRYMELYIEFRHLKDFRVLLELVQSKGAQLDSVDIIKTKEKGKSELAALLSVKFNKKLDHNLLLQDISASELVLYAEEI